MKKYFAILFFSLLFLMVPNFSNAATNSWEKMGNNLTSGTGYFPSMAFDSVGVGYVAYRDDSDSQKLHVKKWNGSAWSDVGNPAGISAGAVWYISLKIAPFTNLPYVAYQDRSDSNNLKVIKFDGSAWVSVGAVTGTVANSLTTGTCVSLSFNTSNNQPWVAFKDFANGGKASVVGFDGTTWSVQDLGFSLNVADSLSLAFNPSTNDPYVAFRDGSFALSVYKKTAGTWGYLANSVQFNSAYVTDVNIGFSPNNNVAYLAFGEWNNSLGDFKATVKKYASSSWVNEGSSLQFSSGGVRDVSLTFDTGNNKPIIAYADLSNSGKPIAVSFDGSAWNNFSSAGFVPGDASNSYSLGLAFNPIYKELSLAFQDMGASFQISVMKFSTFIQGTGTLSMNIPAIINPGQTFTVPLNLNVSAGTLGAWTIDVTMDPNYITIASNSDIANGNVPNAFYASSYLCVSASCNPPSGMQVSRIAGMTGSQTVTGNVTLASLAFTGVAASPCGSIVKVVAKEVVDSTLGAPTTFSPMPAELNLTSQSSGTCGVDVVAPSAPSGLSVI